MNQSNIQWVDNVCGQDSSAVINTPAGVIQLTAIGEVLTRLEWVSLDSALKEAETPILISIVNQLDAYWNNQEHHFSITLLKQGTSFQNQVWQQLCLIEFGHAMTYSGLAKLLGSGPRAVGGACRVNPFPMIVPCHRVVSVAGLGGYAGQTKGDCLEIKRTLLNHEGYLCKKMLK